MTPRRVAAVVAHTGREDAVDAAREVGRTRCRRHGIAVRLLADEAAELGLDRRRRRVAGRATDARPTTASSSLVLGGDGTHPAGGRARPRRPARRCSASTSGHVGFLAEAESEDLDVDGRRDRRAAATTSRSGMTIDVAVCRDGELVAGTWALNEASVEKAARERMLEVVVEIDGRPLSRWGCDGVVCATPTGSTAYAFSAGARSSGPRWRRCCWCRSARTRCSPGRWWSRRRPCSRSRCCRQPAARACCGATAGARSTCRPAPGSRYAAGATPVRLARLHAAPFTDRLVAKFGLPGRRAGAAPSVGAPAASE